MSAGLIQRRRRTTVALRARHVGSDPLTGAVNGLSAERTTAPRRGQWVRQRNGADPGGVELVLHLSDQRSNVISRAISRSSIAGGGGPRSAHR